ncbi:MAG: glutamate--tRNA ligase [Patescibacteria group bacterium]
MKARTRFAPSPTGYLHVGGVRTALFAWLIARQTKGEFILRLEDTDKLREVEGSGEHIMESLAWLGITWDEGIGLPEEGPYAPYRQSQRLSLYKEWAQKLIDTGRAYADPYTPEEVQGFREQAQKEKKPFLYRNHRPENPPAWDGTQPLRFLSKPKPYTWHDEVMGELSAGEEAVDDFIVIKSDGYPTYNFCHIIDDLLMKCTHVIRSQEFIASVPKFLNLYEALEIERPLLATVPFVMGSDGKKKLSKRDGAKDILDYREEGFLPEAMVNFLATLGWNDGTEQEVFSRQELIDTFSLARVQKGGARFDEQRLIWLNGAHIRRLPLEKIYRILGDGISASFWPPEAYAAAYDDEYRLKVLSLVQERLKFFKELPGLTLFFFKDLPVDPRLWQEHKQLKKLEQHEIKQLLEQGKASITESNFSTEDLTKRLNDLLEKTDQKPAVLFSLIRIAITQAAASPGLADTMTVLGKETVLRRIDQMLSSL